MRLTLRVAAVILAGVGVSILAYLWELIGKRGLEADISGTAGYTTRSEVGLGIFGILLVILAGIAYFLTVRAKRG